MTSTRLLTVVTFVLGSAGIVMISAGDSIPLTALGAMLVVGSAIVFARHFWRESDRKRKQELTAYGGAVRAAIAKAPLDQLSKHVSSVTKRIDVFTQGVLEYMAQLELDQQKMLERQEKALADSQSTLLKRLDAAEQLGNKRRDSVVQQVTAVMGLYHRFKPAVPYPPFGGWAIGGECAHHLVSLILLKQPNRVVEIGSGLSTVLMAQALEANGGQGHVVSLEHEPKWLERSRAMVQEHGLGHRVTLVHAPLVDTKIGQEVFAWYDLQAVDLPDQIDFIFIDGPPQGAGPMARYPAVPLFFDRLSDGGVIVMDDASREDERDAIDRWSGEFSALAFQFYNDSKGTVEIIKGET